MTTIAVLLGLMLAVVIAYKVYTAVLRSLADYLLDYFDGDEGHGFVIVRKSDGQRLKWQRIPKSSGLKVFQVAGVSRRSDALQSRAFRLAQRVQLIPEPDNPADPDAIAVFNKNGTVQVGYVPADETQDVHEMIEEDPEYYAMVVWESTRDDERVGIRVLLAAGELSIALA